MINSSPTTNQNFSQKTNDGRRNVHFYYIKEPSNAKVDTPSETNFWFDLFHKSDTVSSTTTHQPPASSTTKRKKSTILTSSRPSKYRKTSSIFEQKKYQLQLAWQAMYGNNEPFPSEFIVLKNTSKIVLPPPQHLHPANTNKLLNRNSTNTTMLTYDSKTHGV